MKVYLVRTKDFNIEDFENVYNLLNAYPGAIEFKNGGTLDLDDPFEIKTFNNKTKFSHQEQIFYSHSETSGASSDYEPPTFPFTKKVYSWRQLFFAVDHYKREKQIVKQMEKHDFVFLLTNHYNDKNWFAFLSESMRTGFIHTDDWPFFFRNSTDIRYPISYEVSAWILRGLMYSNQNEILSGFHKKAIGCLNDFCKNKNEITIKMRTSDVCDDCMKIIKNKDVEPYFLNQLFNIMDGIRSNLLFRKRIAIVHTPSRIKIDLEAKKIFLLDFGNLDIRLNPKELSLYLLFILHKEGIALNSLIDHQEELFGIYQKISGRSNIIEMQNTIYLLVNYLDGELHTNLSRIKSKFKKVLGEEIAEKYYVQMLPNNVHGIPIDREGIIII
jgi:hypothetical protein